MSFIESLSSSPSFKRLSSASSGSRREEELIQSYEAEEERIINVLSRKLEQLREEKISLERVHEEESESHVNRLARELALLRIRQAQQAQANVHTNGAVDTAREAEPGTSNGMGARNGSSFVTPRELLDPGTDVLLTALKKENESLRNRLVNAERDYIRVTRLSEIYREELIQHRRRLGLSVDDLIGMTPATDPYSQPTHRRSSTASSSPTASMVALPLHSARPTTGTHSVPIPRLPSQVHRSHKPAPSNPETPLSRSPSSADSPYMMSPILSLNPESYASHATHLTTPPSSASLQSNPPAPYPMPPPSLTYPSVPPPSLSSSLGSPVVPYHMPVRDPPSPVDLPSRRGSMHNRRYSNDRRVVETGNLRDIPRSRRASVERGARIAETGSLLRNRDANAAPSSSSAVSSTDHSPIIGAYVPSLNETLE